MSAVVPTQQLKHDPVAWPAWLTARQESFAVKEAVALTEYQATGFWLEHRRTGAELIILPHPIEVPRLSLVVATAAIDDSGLPHITEHIRCRRARALPGVPEALAAASLGAWYDEINAQTGSDYTSYDMAAADAAQFYALSRLTLEAALAPAISQKDFEIEGWRVAYEHGALCIRGIVQKEMCGYEGGPAETVAQIMETQLFPDTPRRFNYGGDPNAMRRLTYEAFQDFNDRCYQPRNFKLVLIGSLDPTPVLADYERLLARFEDSPVPETPERQALFSVPRRYSAAYPYLSEGAALAPGMVGLGWILPEHWQSLSAVELELADELIAGAKDSPLRQALRRAALPLDISTGFERARQDSYTVFCYGADPQQAERFEVVWRDCLQKICDRGIPKRWLTSAISRLSDRLELAKLDPVDYGSGLVDGVMASYLRFGSPFRDLPQTAVLKALAQDPEAACVRLSVFFKEALLDNSHRVLLALTPDSSLAVAREREEEAYLEHLAANTSAEDLERIKARSRYVEREARADWSAEALQAVPYLSLTAVPEPARLPAADLITGRAHLYLVAAAQKTELNLMFSAARVPGRLRPYLRILAEVFEFVPEKAGRENVNYAAVSDPDAMIYLLPDAKGASEPYFCVSTSSSSQRFPAELDRTFDVLQLKAWLTPDLVRESVLSAWHSYAELTKDSDVFDFSNRAGAWHSPYCRSHDQLNGIGSLLFLRDLLSRARQGDDGVWEEITAKVLLTAQYLFCRESGWGQLIGSGRKIQELTDRTDQLLTALPESPLGPQDWQPAGGVPFELFPLSSRVTHLAQVLDLRRHGVSREQDGALLILTNFWDFVELWQNIRGDSSAYRVNADWGLHTGLLYFESGFNPDPIHALATFSTALKQVKEFSLSEAMLERAKVAALRQLEPDRDDFQRAFESFERHLSALPLDLESGCREQVRAATLADLRSLAPACEAALAEAATVVGGSRKILDQLQRYYSKQQPAVTII